MIITTENKYEKVLSGKSVEKILFPEYGKDRSALQAFVETLKGDKIITASLELIDILLERFRGEEHFLLYSETKKSLTFERGENRRKRES